MSLTRVGAFAFATPRLRTSWSAGVSLAVAGLTVLTGLTFATPADAAPHKAKAAKHAVANKTDPDRPPASARPIYESIVIDATSGRVLHQVNADTKAYPASLTKMMTLYMLFDALQSGKVRLDTPMKVSQYATTMAPSKLDLTAGSSIAVEQAIYAIVTKSANDVAMVIAEHLGGSEDKFCNMMTARARKIGMSRTQFKNPHGLPNKGQISTARDMAILARHLMTDFPNQFAYFSKTEFPFRGVMIKGHNHFMEKYDGADGLKTGYTFASGFNLAASARRGDTRLIAVVFGGASAKQRDDHMAQLMDAGFSVLQQRPDAIAVAQKVDPFPALVASAAAATIPSPQPTGIVPASQVDDETLVAASGDAEDAIGQQIMTDAPPLNETAALVPAPGTLTAKGKAMAAKSGTLRAKPVSVPPTTASVTAAPTSSWGIQIGAYVNRLQAESQATAAAGKIRAAIAAAAPRVISVKVSAQKTLYRAQVIGLDRKDTAKACKLAGSAAGCKPVGPDQKTVAMR